MDESDSELENFDIDSDPCGADLLELKRELNRLGSEMIQRNLADAIISAQEMTLQRWTVCLSFCAVPAALRHINR